MTKATTNHQPNVGMKKKVSYFDPNATMNEDDNNDDVNQCDIKW